MVFPPQGGCEAKLIYKVVLHHVKETKIFTVKVIKKKN